MRSGELWSSVLLDPLEKPEDLSDCELDSRALVLVVLVVIDVLVSPSSVVTELCEVSSFFSDLEFVESQSSSFCKKWIWTTMQEERRYGFSSVKAPPPSRRKTAPTLLQNSYSSFGWEQEHHEVDSQIWRARENAPWRQSSSSSSIERQR